MRYPAPVLGCLLHFGSFAAEAADEAPYVSDRRISICRNSVTRKKLGGALVPANSCCHATSFVTNLGDTKSNSAPSILSLAVPAANTFLTQSEPEPYTRMKR